jgi:ribosome-associated toxin RatA of RatAB toxin-antitoxin module
LTSALLQHVVDRLLPAMLDDVVTAFTARAHRLYGSPGTEIKGLS